jgi:hypothetical protein
MLADQLATVTIAVVVLLAWGLHKLHDRRVVVRGGAVGYRADGRAAVVPDTRRSSPVFDQDVD